MLWLDPTPRRLAVALYETFVLPWGSDVLAAAVAIAAVIGSCVAYTRDRQAFVLLLVAFGPYAALHLLFQETLTVRYALPTLVPVVWLAARALSSAGRFTSLVAAPLVATTLMVSRSPVGMAYGRESHPAFRAIGAARDAARTTKPAAVYSHYSLWRALQAESVAVGRRAEAAVRVVGSGRLLARRRDAPDLGSWPIPVALTWR